MMLVSLVKVKYLSTVVMAVARTVDGKEDL